MMARYRHWKNYGEGGDCVFITTRALDFAHVFASPEQKDLVVRSILIDCLRFKATLHAYVAMSNHIHLLVNTPKQMTSSDLMCRLKSNSAERILPTLSESQRAAVGIQEGLNTRKLWQCGFRGVPILSDLAFKGKVRYINNNPVRAKLCERPEDYRWSSAYAFVNDAVDQFQDLSLEKALALYRHQ